MVAIEGPLGGICYTYLLHLKVKKCAGSSSQRAATMDGGAAVRKCTGMCLEWCPRAAKLCRLAGGVIDDLNRLIELYANQA